MKASVNPEIAKQIGLIGKTARALAHELKTPLTSIKLNVDLLEDENLQPENKKKSIVLLKREVSRLSEIVDSFLGLTLQHDLQIQTADLKTIISEVVSSLSCLFEKNRISCTYHVPEIMLRIDRTKIESVLFTLLTNSAEAIGENGTIEINAEVNKIPNKISVFITDSGGGVSDAAKIFTPFYTTKPSGNGIGLVLAAEIIRKHGGELKLISSVPGRTIFEISLFI